jgi:hypothetical protein
LIRVPTLAEEVKYYIEQIDYREEIKITIPIQTAENKPYHTPIYHYGNIIIHVGLQHPCAPYYSY